MLIYMALIETEEDRVLFEQIYYKYKGLMFHVAYGVLGQREDAEDAVQMAFEAIAKNIEGFLRLTVPKPVVTSLSLPRERPLIFRERTAAPSAQLLRIGS